MYARGKDILIVTSVLLMWVAMAAGGVSGCGPGEGPAETLGSEVGRMVGG